MSQYYKSISYPKIYNSKKETKIIRLALNEKEDDLIKTIKNLSSSQLRYLLDNRSYDELETVAKKERRSLSNSCIYIIKEKLSKYSINNREQLDLFLSSPSNIELNPYSGTFKNNKNKGIFNWYPYVEGFSYDFVEKIFEYNILHPRAVYDPFAGTGTTLLVCAFNKIKSGYSEINPLMRFIIDTKVEAIKYKDLILSSRKNIDIFINKLFDKYNRNLKLSSNENLLAENNFFRKDILLKLAFIKKQICKSKFDLKIKNMLLLALSSFIVKESNMIRRADLRYKRDSELKEIVDDVFCLFKEKVEGILYDLYSLESSIIGKVSLISENAMKINEKNYSKFDTVITSPPYVNGTNYFRNTKLELMFFDLVKNENDLKYLRSESITSGINNVSRKPKIDKSDIELLNDIISQLERDKYDVRIPSLVEHYFHDMKVVSKNLYQMLEKNGNFYIDIGDSKFKNVHVPTDIIFEKIIENEGFTLISKTKIRGRFSKNGFPLGQWLLHFKKNKKNYSVNKITYQKNIKVHAAKVNLVVNNWKKFRDNLPYRKYPYTKRNWGNKLHSLCSYQGKLKPSIAHFLVNYFSEKNSTVLDPLCGVGTIPLEAHLQNRNTIGNDISLIAFANTLGKVGIINPGKCNNLITELNSYLKTQKIKNKDLIKNDFGFNKNLTEYYHPRTFREIILARKYFIERGIEDENSALVFSSLLHILHGNRPYALSRTSHPITPFAPKGKFIYKSLTEKLAEKVSRVIPDKLNQPKKNYEIFLGDFKDLDQQIRSESVDIVLTSPPFYDSTKFYMANWIRMWFGGWDKNDFREKKKNFLETQQVQDINVYNIFFEKMYKLIKINGSMILHLGFSKKANMVELLIPLAEKYFEVVGYFNENVADNEKFGIKDQGSVKIHQFLFLIKK